MDVAEGAFVATGGCSGGLDYVGGLGHSLVVVGGDGERTTGGDDVMC